MWDVAKDEMRGWSLLQGLWCYVGEFGLILQSGVGEDTVGKYAFEHTPWINTRDGRKDIEQRCELSSAYRSKEVFCLLSKVGPCTCCWSERALKWALCRSGLARWGERWECLARHRSGQMEIRVMTVVYTACQLLGGSWHPVPGLWDFAPLLLSLSAVQPSAHRCWS